MMGKKLIAEQYEKARQKKPAAKPRLAIDALVPVDEAAFLDRDAFGAVAVASVHLQDADLADRTYARCAFNDASLVGCDMSGSIFEDVVFSRCDLSNSGFSSAAFKRCAFEDCKLTGATLFGTSLAGIDFSTCRLDGVVVSDSLEELRGCRMGALQLAGFAHLLGIVVDEG